MTPIHHLTYDNILLKLVCFSYKSLTNVLKSVARICSTVVNENHSSDLCALCSRGRHSQLTEVTVVIMTNERQWLLYRGRANIFP